MAFVDTDSEHPDVPTFYNINSAVGFGCPNIEEDVKVVQFFLQRFFTLRPFAGEKPAGSMSVDGKVGPITRTWIHKFQAVCRRSKQNVLVDGIIDKAGNPENPNNLTSSISRTENTIRALNAVLRHEDKEVYKTLTTNPVVPPDVRMIFLQIASQGPPMNYGSV